MLEKILKEKHGIDALCLDETVSTNLDIKRLAANGLAEWTTVIAKRQSGGRGRLGREFFSPEGGLYMSVLLRPALSPEATLYITTAAAAAVVKAIDFCYGKRCNIKWVNDIILSGKKVCGILCESAFCGDDRYSILGIGVNLYGDEKSIPSQLKNIMGFINNEPQDDEKTALFIAKILEFFEEYYVNLNDAPHRVFYKDRLILSDKADIISENRNEPCKILGLADDFSLIVMTAEGEEHISFGEVSVRL